MLETLMGRQVYVDKIIFDTEFWVTAQESASISVQNYYDCGSGVVVELPATPTSAPTFKECSGGEPTKQLSRTDI